MLTELRRVPAVAAIAIVAGIALVTIGVLAAVDGLSGGRGKPQAALFAAHPRQAAAAHRSHPKPRHRAAPPSKPSPRPEPPRIPLRRLVGAKVIARFSGTSAPRDLLRRIRAGAVGGVIVFPDNVASGPQLRSLTTSLQRAAQDGGATGILIAIDQEGGPVKRLVGPPDRSPAQIGDSGNVLLARSEGGATGSYLRGLGINVDLAPVLDVPQPGSFIASRAFGSSPDRVAALGTAFARGLAESGVAPTAKHFPGLGRAFANTDKGTSVIGAPRPQLDRDLLPFRTAVRSGVPLVMMSTATYPAYASGPAALSSAIVQGQLRGRLQFGGVIVTDDLDGRAIRALTPPAQAAVAAAQAGVDMVLLATDPASSSAAYHALLDAAKAGTLPRRALEESYARIGRVQATYAGRG